MKYILLTLGILWMHLVVAQKSFLNWPPRNQYSSIVEQYCRFSPFTNNPDSFFVKLFHDEDFVLDTLIPHKDTVNFYMRGYYKTFNPFLLNAERVEVYLFESDVMRDNKKSGKKVLTYNIIGIIGTEPGDFLTARDEEKRIHKKMKKAIGDYTTRKTKAKGNTYVQHLYRIGTYVPFYTKYGVWYKTGVNNCVAFSINLASLEEIKITEARW